MVCRLVVDVKGVLVIFFVIVLKCWIEVIEDWRVYFGFEFEGVVYYIRECMVVGLRGSRL